MMRRPGIEPGPPAWQASILPLNHRRTYHIHQKDSIIPNTIKPFNKYTISQYSLNKIPFESITQSITPKQTRIDQSSTHTSTQTTITNRTGPAEGTYNRTHARTLRNTHAHTQTQRCTRMNINDCANDHSFAPLQSTINPF